MSSKELDRKHKLMVDLSFIHWSFDTPARVLLRANNLLAITAFYSGISYGKSDTGVEGITHKYVSDDTVRVGILLLTSNCKAEELMNGTYCPVCHHMDLHFRYMSQQYIDIYRNAIMSDEAGLDNPTCLTRNVEPLLCEEPLYPVVEESRCKYRRVTMHLQGLINHLPRAELIVKWYVRGCTIEWKRDENGCKDFKELSEDEQGALIRELHPIQKRWKIATYFGTICTI